MTRFSGARGLARLLFLLFVLTAPLPWLYVRKDVTKQQFVDFRVYHTAASLVVQHESRHLYDGADSGENPLTRLADPCSPFAAQARALGYSEMMLYLYPPMLADVLAPLGWLHAGAAALVWLLFDVVALAIIWLLGTTLLDVPWASEMGLAAGLLLMALAPVWDAFITGQVTILLLLLWIVALTGIARGKNLLPAVCLALAAAVKLTALLVVLPLLAWHRKKLAGAFAVVLGVLFLGMMWVNTPGVVLHYFDRVLPAMSLGIVSQRNVSLPSVIAMLLLVAHGVNPACFAPVYTSPHFTQPDRLLLRYVPLAILAGMVGLTRLGDLGRTDEDRMQLLAGFALLTAIISPVSWYHAYVVAYPLLALMWSSAFAGRMTRVETSSLFLGSLIVGTQRHMRAFPLLESSHPFLTVLSIGVYPAAALGLVALQLMHLCRIRRVPASLLELRRVSL